MTAARPPSESPCDWCGKDTGCTCPPCDCKWCKDARGEASPFEKKLIEAHLRAVGRDEMAASALRMKARMDALSKGPKQ